MKTFSEVQRERAEEHKRAQEEERLTRERDVYYLEHHVETKSIPLHAGTTEDDRKGLREEIRSGRAEAADVACDGCGTQLFFPSPQFVALTGVRQIRCPGCGWLGWL
jgi:hypothetical protein